MSANIVSWNLRDGFTNPDVNEMILQDHIFRAEPDIAVFPEARSEQGALSNRVMSRFEQEGYEVFDTDYNDDNNRADRHGLLVIARPELVIEHSVVRLAGRNALSLTLNGGASFLGAHLTDWTPNPSNTPEAKRVKQIHDALHAVGRQAIIAGDFNEMHRRTLKSATLRLIKPFVDALPSEPPQRGIKERPIRRAGSILQRVASTGNGTAIEELLQKKFVDAGSKSLSTIEKGVVGLGIDHIFVRDLPIVSATVVAPKTPHSDHNLISARILV